MNGHSFKIPGLIRAGFQYQDLVAIEVLIDFYRNRKRCQWVKLDAEESEFRSIEDVVVCTNDGRFELMQVKFTANPTSPDNSLSWDWLTKKRRKGTSLIQKWATTTLNHEARKTLASAILKTDRVPAPDFLRYLIGKKIIYSKLDKKHKRIVTQQIGSKEKAKLFFEKFEFDHSLPHLEDLERKLWARISSDTDRGGWSLFREQVQRWSTLKGEPKPDGKIKYAHLQQALSVERSKPLPQGFEVPKSYRVPDAEFDKKFRSKITSKDGVTVLWGSPGRGKSTYLSFCVSKINKTKAVCVRHHYFLSLDDRSEGRFSYYAISNSIKHQLEKVCPGVGKLGGELGESIQAVAQTLKRSNVRLIIVIDGLDHVWREHRDHEDMELLFNALLPIPENVSLVIGTQKIQTINLPTKLLVTNPMNKWIELPLMSPAAVYDWLQEQNSAGRLNLESRPDQNKNQLVRSLAKSFYEISKGLPLHLIYSFEAAAHSGKALNNADIRALPACPSGDIRDYYRLVWGRLTRLSQAILHLLSGIEFAPPPTAMEEFFGRDNSFQEAIGEILHLLNFQEIGIQPFHGSLYAFVLDCPNHDSIFATHLPTVIRWLEVKAPEYWRQSWLWITRAQAGDTKGLASGPNRAWAIDFLTAGYPIDNLINVLRHAENAAFKAFDLARLVNLRCIKTRALNGPEFQTDQWAYFVEVAVALSDDPYVRAHLESNLRQTHVSIIPVVVRGADSSFQKQIFTAALTELNERLRYRDTSEIVASDHQARLAESIIAVASTSPDVSIQRVVEFTKRGVGQDNLLSKFASISILCSNFENVFSVGEHFSGPKLDREVFTALCFEGVAPSTKAKLKALKNPSVQCLDQIKTGSLKRKQKLQSNVSSLFIGEDGPDARSAEDTREILYANFFWTLSESLSGRQARATSALSAVARSTWLGCGLAALEDLAAYVALAWRTKRRWPTLGEIYTRTTVPEFTSDSHNLWRRFVALRLALRDIAIDLCLISVAIDPNALIELEDIRLAANSNLWHDDLWIDAFCERRVQLHSSYAAQELIERVSNRLSGKVSDFHERATLFSQLAIFALDNRLPQTAKKELKNAYNCLLGYGHRKDPFAHEVLESLSILADHRNSVAIEKILDLAGAFEEITEYTDGDETDSARETYYEVVARYASRLAPGCYANLILKEEWRYADRLLTAIVQEPHADSRLGQALLETCIEESDLLELASLNPPPSGHKERALNELLRKTGRSISSIAQSKTKSRENDDRIYSDKGGAKQIAFVEPQGFPPGTIHKFVAAARDTNDYFYQLQAPVDWLNYWVSAGQSIDALNDLERLIVDDLGNVPLEKVCDLAFDVAISVQGRSKAFEWIIRAHIMNDGWNRWFSNTKESRARLKKLAQNYRRRWQEIIEKTSKSRFGSRRDPESKAIGLSNLVYFLVEAGEQKLAEQYALAMAQAFQEELDGQPIRRPVWVSR
jgi:hypothetical protein